MTKTYGTFQRLAIAAPFGKLFAAVSNGVACVDVSTVEAIDAAADKETRGQLAALDAASTSRAQLPSPKREADGRVPADGASQRANTKLTARPRYAQPSLP